MEINFSSRECNVKIVYYGPGLSGKTTNLEVIHARTPEDNRGNLTALATDQDRTLFFDYMPLEIGEISGLKIRLRLFTVPGQVYYNSTRKLVLRCVDGVVFIADSQIHKKEENVESLENLRTNLEEHGLDLRNLPFVIQFNKRDLPNVMTLEEMEELLNGPYKAPCFPAVAMKGDGVFQCLKSIANLSIAKVEENIKNRSRGKKPQRQKIGNTPPMGANPRKPTGPLPFIPPKKREQEAQRTFSTGPGMKRPDSLFGRTTPPFGEKRPSGLTPPQGNPAITPPHGLKNRLKTGTSSAPRFSLGHKGETASQSETGKFRFANSAPKEEPKESTGKFRFANPETSAKTPTKESLGKFRFANPANKVPQSNTPSFGSRKVSSGDVPRFSFHSSAPVKKDPAAPPSIPLFQGRLGDAKDQENTPKGNPFSNPGNRKPGFFKKKDE